MQNETHNLSSTPDETNVDNVFTSKNEDIKIMAKHNSEALEKFLKETS